MQTGSSPHVFPVRPTCLGLGVKMEYIRVSADPLNEARTDDPVQSVEVAFAALVGAPASLALNSPMAAFQTALLALDIGRGDGVIASPLSCCGAVNAIEQVGARPILADVEPGTLTLEPRTVEEAIERCRADLPGVPLKAIAPTHYQGQPVELALLYRLVRTYGLALVEDATHAMGAQYRDGRIGQADEPDSGHAVCFAGQVCPSDNGADGGFITGGVHFIARARVISHHGARRASYGLGWAGGLEADDIIYPGFDFAMTESQARQALEAIGLAAVAQTRRATLAARYSAAFAGRAELETPRARPGIQSAWPTYPLRLNMECFRLAPIGRRAVFRDQFVQALRERGVAARTPGRPMHLHPYYRNKYGYQPDDFPVAYGEYRRMLLLPLDGHMTDTAVDATIEAVLDVARGHRR